MLLYVTILLFALALTNLLYQVTRKPTELFAFVGHRLDKEPPETWRQYGPLFRSLSTGTITPELLAALAQVESSGNPVARTYWRWRWSRHSPDVAHAPSGPFAPHRSSFAAALRCACLAACLAAFLATQRARNCFAARKVRGATT